MPKFRGTIEGESAGLAAGSHGIKGGFLKDLLRHGIDGEAWGSAQAWRPIGQRFDHMHSLPAAEFTARHAAAPVGQVLHSAMSVLKDLFSSFYLQHHPSFHFDKDDMSSGPAWEPSSPNHSISINDSAPFDAGPAPFPKVMPGDWTLGSFPHSPVALTIAFPNLEVMQKVCGFLTKITEQIHHSYTHEVENFYPLPGGYDLLASDPFLHLGRNFDADDGRFRQYDDHSFGRGNAAFEFMTHKGDKNERGDGDRHHKPEHKEARYERGDGDRHHKPEPKEARYERGDGDRHPKPEPKEARHERGDGDRHPKPEPKEARYERGDGDRHHKPEPKEARYERGDGDRHLKPEPKEARHERGDGDRHPKPEHKEARYERGDGDRHHKPEPKEARYERGDGDRHPKPEPKEARHERGDGDRHPKPEPKEARYERGDGDRHHKPEPKEARYERGDGDRHLKPEPKEARHERGDGDRHPKPEPKEARHERDGNAHHKNDDAKPPISKEKAEVNKDKNSESDKGAIVVRNVETQTLNIPGNKATPDVVSSDALHELKDELKGVQQTEAKNHTKSAGIVRLQKSDTTADPQVAPPLPNASEDVQNSLDATVKSSVLQNLNDLDSDLNDLDSDTNPSSYFVPEMPYLSMKLAVSDPNLLPSGSVADLGNMSFYEAVGDQEGGLSPLPDQALMAASTQEAVDAPGGLQEAHGSETDDFIVGTSGPDIIHAHAGSDVIWGGAGNDVLSGEDGKDRLEGGENNDTLSGGPGDDFLVGGSGTDLLNGGEGHDTVDMRDVTGGVKIDLSELKAQDGDETDTLISIENALGGSGNDEINGNIENNDLSGLEGDDLIKAGDGNDSLHGGTGSDVMQGDGGADGLFGEGGDDVLSGGEGGDVLSGGRGADLLSGGSGRDVFAFDFEDSTSSITDIILDFEDGDLIRLPKPHDAKDGHPFSSLKIDQGNDFTSVGCDQFYLKLAGDVTLTASDFIFSTEAH